MSDIPTLQEELERKTVEILVRLDSQIKAGAIDPRGAWVTAQTVWTLTSGLVSSEASQAAAELANNHPCPFWRRVFLHPTKAALLLYVQPGKLYALRKPDSSGGYSTVKQARHEPGDLEAEVNHLVDRLKANGYTEI